MKIENKFLKKYVYLILKLIFLTNLISVLLFWKNFNVWLGFLLGSLAGSFNLYFQAKETEKEIQFTPKQTKLNVFKNFYVRYLTLFATLFLIIKFLPVNLIALTFGVISIQIVLFAHGLISGFIKKNSI